MLKRNLIIGIVIIVALFATTSAILTIKTPRTVSPASNTGYTSLEVRLSIDGVTALRSMTISEDATALDLLRKAHEESGFDLEEKNYPGMGTLVERIDGRKNGEGGKYWLYYVNGSFAEVGADTYRVRPHDVIEWKFEVPTQY